MNQTVGNITNSSVSNVNTTSSHEASNSPFFSAINWFLVIANILLLIANLYFVCNYFPRSSNLQFDYAGVIVATFSTLITLLVGWNIFSAITIERKVNSAIEKRTEKVKQEMTEQINMAARAATFMTLSQNGNAFYHKANENIEELAYAAQFLLNAQAAWLNDHSIREFSEEANEYSVNRLKEIACRKPDVILCVETEIEKASYVETALKIGDKDIIRFVNNIQVR